MAWYIVTEWLYHHFLTLRLLLQFLYSHKTIIYRSCVGIASHLWLRLVSKQRTLTTSTALYSQLVLGCGYGRRLIVLLSNRLPTRSFRKPLIRADLPLALNTDWLRSQRIDQSVASVSLVHCTLGSLSLSHRGLADGKLLICPGSRSGGTCYIQGCRPSRCPLSHDIAASTTWITGFGWDRSCRLRDLRLLQEFDAPDRSVLCQIVITQFSTFEGRESSFARGDSAFLNKITVVW